ncbi:MAG: fluoride efflux transporter CrcB [Pirellulaceae bacterium]
MRDFFSSFSTLASSLLTNKLLLLAMGGAVGTNARYWLGRSLGEVGWAKGFPLGTFVINVTGSFILGVAAVLILERFPPAHQHWYLLVGTGFCGGYTTFSTFELETFRLVRDGSFWLALANVAGSVLVGFLGVLVAVALTELVLPRR